MVLSAVTNELSSKLTGLRIDKIYQPAREEIHLLLSKSGTKYRLVLSTDPGMARIHLTNKVSENPPSPPVFCMVLRKHLEGSRVAGFSQAGYDRVLTISVETRDELGRPSLKQIICEIMGRHSNIILYDPETGFILDGIKRYSHAVSRHREVLPGRLYVPAPAQQKVNPLSLSDEEFFKLLMKNDLDSLVAKIIQQHFEGLSPLMAREVVFRAGLEPTTTLNTCGEVDLVSLYTNMKDLYARAEKGEFIPTIVYDGKSPIDFAAFNLTHFFNFSQKSASMNEITDSYFNYKIFSEKVDRSRQSLLNILKKEKTKLEKKLSAQTADLETASNADSLKLSGELVIANIHRLSKGDTEVDLENFYEEGFPSVKIILNPQLSPAENAQSFFHQYAKSKKSLASTSIYAEVTRNEIDYLAGVENFLEMSSTPEELDQIRLELIDQGYLKSPGQRTVKRKEQDLPQPATYTSSNGFTILVGKNNRQNDYLTTKIARKEDIWLHTKNIPGAHVVIKTEDREVPSVTLEEAATLAALFSKAGRSRKVPVDYALRKFVNKPKGSKPGFVIYCNQKTVIIDPDETLPERLARK